MDKREEQLKLEIAKKYFPQFDCTHILGNIDFSVAVTGEKDELFHGTQYLLWAEAKKGTKANIYDSLVQLIMTIGKERPFEKVAPPIFLGAFDEEKMAFIQYYKIQEVFFQNDFDWTVAPSDHSTKEFLQLKALVSQEIADQDAEAYFFYYGSADRALEKFIRRNFKVGKESVSLLPITKNNFTFIFYKWRTQVKPTIAVDWDGAKKKGVLEGHFFLADILSENNKSIFDKLHVVLQGDRYFVDQNLEDSNIFNSANIAFKDGMKAHNAFWSKYKRPPRKEFWDYFIERVDLLTPQDVRERKGSYFTPQIWVEKSQEYLADVLGEDWQDEYYIWDCCAGTGNMETGLTNKYRVWASTLDVADVKIMHERIEKGANLLPAHCFQFDFLNDDLQDPKVPEDLRKILADPERRKKLIIYINPPYAETATKKTQEKDRINKRGVSFSNTRLQYADTIGIATKELFAQFFVRVKSEISGCHLAQFSTLKFVQGPNFDKFRHFFTATYLKGFVVPASSFDNVKGSFPIGFMIWNLDSNNPIKSVNCDIYDAKGNNLGARIFHSFTSESYITDWYRPYHFREDKKNNIGAIGLYGSDFQHDNFIYITNPSQHTNRWTFINQNNLIVTSIYLSVRHCIDSTWINDRDQYLYPNSGWFSDKEFQSDCLINSIFHKQNRIMSKHGTNHWIPFTEEEVGAKMAFDSHFMSDFIRGKHKHAQERDLFNQDPTTPQDTLPSGRAGEGLGLGLSIVFSPEAQAVFDAGRELWRYYHSFYGANPNASFYDIRAYFQGQDDKGRMNPDSQDEHYTELIQDLRQKQRVLAKKIEIGVYKYGFLYNGAPAAEDEPNTPQDTLPLGRAGEGLTPETNLKDIVKHHKPSSKKVINYNITVQGDLKVDQMIGKQQK